MGANVVMVITIAQVLNAVMSSEDVDFTRSILIIMAAAILRICCVKLAATASFKESKNVKRTVRGLLYDKI